ncbi:MAG TPA: hypothetical protein EYG98_05975 [Sulfurovum sp.]|nr:hypothetical protein [Sulfurovum sp.]
MNKQNMNFWKKNLKRFLISNFSLLILISCGYKPVSHYTKSSIASPIYIDVKISTKEPENGIFLKDRLAEMISTRLGSSVTTDKQSINRLSVSYENITYTALSYDTNGYVSRYRTNVTTIFDLKSTNKNLTRRIVTTHEADINPSALESSRIKRESIQECSKKAIDQFVAYTSAASTK